MAQTRKQLIEEARKRNITVPSKATVKEIQALLRKSPPEQTYTMCSKCGELRATSDMIKVGGKMVCDAGKGCNVPQQPVPTPTPAPTPAPTTKTITRKKPTGDHRIHIVSAVCPKKPGSKGERNWGLYVEGMTVNAYHAACLKDGKVHPAGADLKWNKEHGFIRILAPADYDALMEEIAKNEELLAKQGHVTEETADDQA